MTKRPSLRTTAWPTSRALAASGGLAAAERACRGLDTSVRRGREPRRRPAGTEPARRAPEDRKSVRLKNAAPSPVQEAAMRLRAHRRNLVGWSPPVGQAGRYGAPRLASTRRIRRFIRIGALLTAIGLIRLARGLRPRWRPVLAGVLLTVAGFILRGSLWG